jgi:hypothetical protein
MGFFTPQVLREIGRYLVLHYFPLTQEDLQCWDEDPEEFSMSLTIVMYAVYILYGF